MILDAKKIEYKALDVAASEEHKKAMRRIAGDDKALPPQICNGETYCGVSVPIREVSSFQRVVCTGFNRVGTWRCDSIYLQNFEAFDNAVEAEELEEFLKLKWGVTPIASEWNNSQIILATFSSFSEIVVQWIQTCLKLLINSYMYTYVHNTK